MSDDTRAIAADETLPVDRHSDQPWGRFRPNALQRWLIRLVRSTPFRRGVFRPTMTRLIMAMTGRPLDVAFRDCAFRLYGRNNLIEFGILLTPDYNAVDIDFLLDGAAEGGNFVDIGCNIGLYALPMAKRAGRDGQVVAIDANPLMTDRLKRNAEASKIDNVSIVTCGISDEEGHASLRIRKDDIAIVSLDESGGDIPVRTLASVIEEAGLTSIEGLKIDIEGHEDKALVPFLESAPEALLPKRVVIEHPLPDEDYPGCAAAFDRLGYQLIGRTRNNSLYRRLGA